MESERHVRKSNIFAEGRYRFGVNEQRILLTIISKIKMTDKEFKPYRVTWKQFREITRKRITTSESINEVCEKLKGRTIIVKDGSKIHGYGFLSGWTIEPGKWVEFRIDPCMKNMLLDLLEEGRFILYKLECILSLGSSYSIRLYEILKAHEWKNAPLELKLDDLRWKLGVPKESKSWKRFDIFRQKILDKAQKDLAKHTDLKFTYEKILELRKVKALRITIQKNEKYQTTISSHVGKKDLVQGGDTVVFDGKEYVVEGDCIRLKDGVMAIGKINEFYNNGRITKK